MIATLLKSFRMRMEAPQTSWATVAERSRVSYHTLNSYSKVWASKPLGALTKEDILEIALRFEREFARAFR